MVVAILVAHVEAGCSLLAVQGPPDTLTSRCTESVAAPVLDLLFGVPLTVGGGFIAYEADQKGFAGDEGGLTKAVFEIGLVGLGLGVLYDISAGFGFNRTDECRSYHRAIAEPDRLGPSATSSNKQRPEGGDE